MFGIKSQSGCFSYIIWRVQALLWICSDIHFNKKNRYELVLPIWKVTRHIGACEILFMELVCCHWVPYATTGLDCFYLCYQLINFLFILRLTVCFHFYCLLQKPLLTLKALWVLPSPEAPDNSLGLTVECVFNRNHTENLVTGFDLHVGHWTQHLHPSEKRTLF